MSPLSSPPLPFLSFTNQFGRSKKLILPFLRRTQQCPTAAVKRTVNAGAAMAPAKLGASAVNATAGVSSRRYFPCDNPGSCTVRGCNKSDRHPIEGQCRACRGQGGTSSTCNYCNGTGTTGSSRGGGGGGGGGGKRKKPGQRVFITGQGWTTV